MLIANPSDKMIYYYMEGMQFPMGSFRSYGGHIQTAVRIVDRSIRENEPGVYSSRVKIPAAGDYQIAFLLDSPRIMHCFQFVAKENPGRPRKTGPVPHIEFLTQEKQIPVGGDFRLRFKVMDLSKNESVNGLEDVLVMAMSPGSGWSQKFWAKDSGEGIYEVSFAAPNAGVYYVSFSCQSLKADFRKLPYLVLEAKGDKPSQ